MVVDPIRTDPGSGIEQDTELLGQALAEAAVVLGELSFSKPSPA